MQKGDLKPNVTRKQSTPNFLINEHFLPSGGKTCSFFGKFGVVCFRVTPVLTFALLPHYQRFHADLNKCDSQACHAMCGNYKTESIPCH